MTYWLLVLFEKLGADVHKTERIETVAHNKNAPFFSFKEDIEVKKTVVSFNLITFESSKEYFNIVEVIYILFYMVLAYPFLIMNDRKGRKIDRRFKK